MRAQKIYPMMLTVVMLILSIMRPVSGASETEATEITQEYDRLHKLWLAEMRMAPDQRALEVITKKRPNAADYGAK